MKASIRKFLSVCLLAVLVSIMCSSAFAAYQPDYNKKLPKNTTIGAEATTSVSTTGIKKNKNQSARHSFKTCSKSYSQFFRMKRSDKNNTSVTSTLEHKPGKVYNMGVGSTTLIVDYTYNLYGRGNTDNGGEVTITGAVDADGGAAI